MSDRLRRTAAGFAAVCMLMAGCGSNDGIDFTGDISGAAAVIRQAMTDRSKIAELSFKAQKLGQDEVVSIAEEMVQAAFYESDDPKGGDYLRFQYGGYELSYTAGKGLIDHTYEITLTPSYYTTKEQEDKVDERVAEVIAGFGLEKEASEYEKIRCVYDFICDNTSYDTVHKHMPGSKHFQSTAYGALIYKTALCQGYSVLAYRLLKELGIDARIVTGTADSGGETERHSWNIVGIGGKYYNLDVTMGDAKKTDAYFLKSDDDIAFDHTKDDKYKTDEFLAEYPMSEESYK